MKQNYNWSSLFIRLITGIGFMVHGYAKISRGGNGFEKLLIQTGIPFPHIAALITPYIELLGGLAILLGIFIIWAAIPLIVTMLVAMFCVQIHYGFSSVNTTGLTAQGPKFGPPGYEINLLYIASMLSLIFTGAGKWSLNEVWTNLRK